MARKPDKVVVVAAVLLVCALSAVVYVSTKSSPVAPPPGPAPLPEVPAPADAGSDLESKLDTKKPKSKKAQLVKQELKKRAEAEKKLAAVTTPKPPPPPASIDVVLSGDDKLKRALEKRMKGVHIADGGSAHGFALSLRSESGKQGGNVYVRCSAAIAELPAKKLVGSLASRADVPGGSDADKSAASDACAASLAEDVSSWVHQHR